MKERERDRERERERERQRQRERQRERERERERERKIHTVFPRKAAATIYFSATAMQRLFEGGAYSRWRLILLRVLTCNLELV